MDGRSLARCFPSPKFGLALGIKAWWDAAGEVFFGDLAIIGKLFADSAPLRIGEITFEEIGLHNRLRVSAHKQFGTRQIQVLAPANRSTGSSVSVQPYA
jgi:hypothetical protein